jgi:hypothetical protein
MTTVNPRSAFRLGLALSMALPMAAVVHAAEPVIATGAVVGSRVIGLEALGVSERGGGQLAVQRYKSDDRFDLQVGGVLGGAPRFGYYGLVLSAVGGSHTGLGVGAGLRAGLRFERAYLGVGVQQVYGTRESGSASFAFVGYQFK